LNYDGGGNPNAIIEPNFCIFDSASLPIGTNSIPCPIDGPPIPIGAPT